MEIQDRFRVWDKRLNRYLGEYDPTPMLMSNGNLAYLDDAGMEFYEVEQCIGLKDKNSKLIYYNDYVNYKGNIYKVFWNKTKISLENILNNDIIDIIDIIDVEEFNSMEIIGNEHENKELLND